MNALQKSLKQSWELADSVRKSVNGLARKGGFNSMLAAGDGFSSLTSWNNNTRYRERYSLFRGIVYSAVNAIASEGAKQSILVGRLQNTANEDKKPEPKKLRGTKAIYANAFPNNLRQKAINGDIEVLDAHALQQALENPNSIQNKWQFTYSFIASLCLTGWGFVVQDEDKEGKLELYSLPSSWITPLHEKGPFAEFKVQNPKRPETEGKTLKAAQVGFAYLPNPADPLTAMSPAASQMPAIRADDHIWTSRQQFFENGIFPGAIVTIGTDPHPDVPRGTRPRLTASQRRQIYSAVGKLMGGVANYGNPAIIDGLIEKIERLSMASNEMGWEKSEKSTKTSILSAFCVHPYILGEPVGVGGYAQVANIEKRFCSRVNTYLEALSNVLTNFGRQQEGEDDLVIWLDPCKAVDDQLEWSNYKAGRQTGDVSQNEFRAKLGLPPDEDSNEAVIQKGLLSPITALLEKKSAGAITREQVENILKGLGLPDDLAVAVAGEEYEPPPEPVAPPVVPGQEEEIMVKPGGPKPAAPPKEEDPKKVEEELKKAADEIRSVPMDIAVRVAKAILNDVELIA